MKEISPNILALDTSLDGCHIGLLSEGVMHFELQPMARGQSEQLIPLIDTLLKAHRVSYADLHAIAVTTGPGSFTGTRIALAAAQSFALACNIPLIGLTTLEAVAGQDTCTVAIDTKRSEAFIQSFENGVARDQARICPTESCNNILPKTNLRTNISHLGGEMINVQEMIAYLCTYARDQYLKEGENRISQVKPTYLRDAETSTAKIQYRKISK